MFIYGNESHGIPYHVIQKIKTAIPDTMIVSVPQLGIMRSHNVATTCTIVLWEYARTGLYRAF
jgi:tRNA(Leu) C34 or U34 (ribose-2'-O)-methylase TrmL